MARLRHEVCRALMYSYTLELQAYTNPRFLDEMTSVTRLLLTLLSLSYRTEAGEIVEPDKTCKCIPFWLCENGTEVIDGNSLLDIRSISGRITRNKRQLTNECKNDLDICCLSLKVNKGCGIRNFKGFDTRKSDLTDDRARLGEFPWMISVLNRINDKRNLYVCGGSLIHHKVVLTAAHCVDSLDTSTILIRAGEWDTQSTDEDFPHQDIKVESIRIHDDYSSKSLHNDFALLILVDPVRTTPIVSSICLPKFKDEFEVDQCTATGWGKNKFGKGGEYQTVLKSVDFSIVPSNECQNRLRRTRLRKFFQLDDSFICAIGSNGRDMCKGDGGSPLICPLKYDTNRYVQVGIVSWGIGCGNDVPAVYANVLHARNWIDEQLLIHNLDSDMYLYRQSSMGS